METTIKKVLYFTILLSAVLSIQAGAQETSIFPKGEIATNTENFTGTIWLNHLSEADSVFNFNLAVASYAPGSKLDWHIHPAGQILLITEGTGYYQERGKPVQIVHQGEVIKCPPGVEHWHGAAPESEFAYLAITMDEPTKWLERVSDEKYRSINPPQIKKDSAVKQDTSIFSKGFVAPNTDDYMGTVWLNGLSRADSVFPFNLMLATFAPGSRLRWHIHPDGQILLITKGMGYYIEKGKPGRIVHQGDVIICPPGVAHTHSAAPSSNFAYIGIEGNGIKWLQKVTAEEYYGVNPYYR